MEYSLFGRLSIRILVLATLVSQAVVGAEATIYPSAKYPGAPFAEAVAYNGVLYLSGDLGVGLDGKLVAGGIGPESRQTLENIQATLRRHGLEMADIIKCTVFLADISEWTDFNDVYVTFFGKGRYPARSALAASGLALGARVEVECLAALREE